MSNCAFGYPFWSDVLNANYTPALTGGSWLAGLPLANLQDRRMEQVARSTNATNQSTRFFWNLQRACRVGMFAIPKHTLSTSAKVRVLAQATPLLFDYEAGDDIVSMGGTFTRASVATYMDSAGLLRTAASGEARDGHFIGGLRHIILEQQRINLCLQSENFGTTWTAVNTPTRVAANQTFGSLVLDLIGDTSAVNQARYDQAITFTGDAVKAISCFFTQGTSTAATVGLFDNTAAVYRLNAVITWTAGVPSIQMVNGSLIKLEPWGTVNGVTLYRALFVTTSVTAANSNLFRVFPASDVSGSVALTGTVNMGGMQAEDALVPSSYMKTTTTTFTRVLESLQFPIGFLPQAMTIYEKHMELGGMASGTNPSYVTFGGWGGAAGYSVTTYSAGGAASAQVDAGEFNGTTQVNASAATLSAVYGDVAETRLSVSAAGVLQVSASKNGAAESTAAASAAQALNAGWATGNFMRLNDRGGAAVGCAAFRSVRVMAGSTQTRTTMQNAVYDSGWLDVWPQVFPVGSLPSDDPRMVTQKYSAEDVGNVNIGFTHVLPASIVATTGSVQIDDPTNVAGYVDLARFAVANIYQPTLNLVYGAKLNLVTATTFTEMDGGARRYNPKPRRREQVFTIQDLSQDEALVNGYDMQRVLGTHGQLHFVFDTADTFHMHRRAMLCTVRELSALEYPYFNAGDSAYVLTEEL